MTPRLDVIGLVVADLAGTIAFYRHLGLEFVLETEDHAECELPGGIRLMLDTEELTRSFTPGWSRPSGSPRVAFAFQVDTPSEVDDLFHKLVAAGYQGEREPWDAFWGQRYATVLDPNGNGVDLYARLPTA